MPGGISLGQQLGLGLWPAWAVWTGLGSEPPGYGLFGGGGSSLHTLAVSSAFRAGPSYRGSCGCPFPRSRGVAG